MLPNDRVLAAAFAALTFCGRAGAVPEPPTKLAPKVLIISMYGPEGQVWYDRFPESGLGNIASKAIQVPGLSMLLPYVYCTQDVAACQFTTGEGEINAAVSVTALVFSSLFDLSNTYILIAGIAGVNPREATIGSVALSRYAVQPDLEQEIDPRELPPDWPTGYFAMGTNFPGEYPTVLYGTEVFELNENLRVAAYHLASKATLQDQDDLQSYRDMYSPAGASFQMALESPSIVKCDTITTNEYFSGTHISGAFENTTAVWTNHTGTYCMSAQEDNATLEALVRAAIQGYVDFSRIILLRAGSDFDRAPPGVSALAHLTEMNQNGFTVAIANIYNAGIEIVRGILTSWDCTYAHGIKPDNYIGDIFGSLGGLPDFGPGSITNGERVKPAKGSSLSRKLEMGRRARLGKASSRK